MSNQAFSAFEKLIPTTVLALACQLLVLLIVIAFTTLVLSNTSYAPSSSNQKDKPRKVAIIPYWLPYFGHLSLLLNRTSKLRHARRNSPSGIFALRLFGTKYIMVWTPSLIDAAFNVAHASLNSTKPSWALLREVFGADGRGKDEYAHMYTNNSVPRANALLGSGGIRISYHIIQPMLRAIEQHAPNLLSFAERPIDQNAWEQNVNPVFHDSSSVEISFFELISRFVAHVSLPALIGTEFLEIYPTTVEDLWDLDGGFKWLRLGFSRLWGIPSLTRAHIARRRLLTALQSFHMAADAVSNGDDAKEPWREVGDLSEVMKERRKVWNRFQTSTGVRAACDLNLLWATSTKPACLVFWMLLHLHADPILLTQIRAEIAHFVLITQPPKVLFIPSPPRLSIDAPSLVRYCPLLKSCLYECLRLYTSPIPTRFVDKDTIIRDPNGKVQSHQDYILEKGSYIATPLTLHHHNPRYFWQPNEFQPRRFLKANENDSSADHDTHQHNENTTQHPSTFRFPTNLHPFGIGPSACPARLYAETEILTFVAAIISLWEFSPADSKEWIIPDRTDRHIVSMPNRDVRVKVQARKLS